MAELDRTLIIQALKASDDLREQTEEEMLRRFDLAKKKLIESFRNHPVSVEIEEGVSATNLSGTLGGYGNLFTFIGFPANAKPMEGVYKLLETSIRIVPESNSSNDLKFNFSIVTPSEEEILAASPLPWLSGKSWLLSIETGIDGLNNYLAGRYGEAKESRSGGGLEASKPIRATAFQTVNYYQTMLQEFIEELQ